MKEATFAGAEWLCVLIVIVASVSLGWTPEQEAVDEPEVVGLEGTVTLATRDAMDALGLQDFQPGAVAAIDLTRERVAAPPCEGCEHSLTGIMVQGPVLLTGLVDETGRLGRIEANLNLTHMMERGPDGFVHREWLLLDWDAGDRSSAVEVLLVHDPPRWLPGEDRSDATLLTTEEGQISRSGPDVRLGGPAPWLMLAKSLMLDTKCREAQGQSCQTMTIYTIFTANNSEGIYNEHVADKLTPGMRDSLNAR